MYFTKSQSSVVTEEDYGLLFVHGARGTGLSVVLAAKAFLHEQARGHLPILITGAGTSGLISVDKQFGKRRREALTCNLSMHDAADRFEDKFYDDSDLLPYNFLKTVGNSDRVVVGSHVTLDRDHPCNKLYFACEGGKKWVHIGGDGELYFSTQSESLEDVFGKPPRKLKMLSLSSAREFVSS